MQLNNQQIDSQSIQYVDFVGGMSNLDMKADLESSLSTNKVINIKLTDLEQNFESSSPRGENVGSNLIQKKSSQGPLSIF